MRRDLGALVRLAAGAAMALMLSAGAVAAASAPTEAAATPSPICSVLTAKEINSAMGAKLDISESDQGQCTWGSLASGFLNVTYVPGTLADVTLLGQPKQGQVGGHPALILVQPNSGSIHTQTDDHVLGLSWLGRDPAGGLESALTKLTEKALPRLAALPVPSTPSPAPTLSGYATPGPDASLDPVLAALFPADLPGGPLAPEAYTIEQVLGFFDPADPAAGGATNALYPLLAGAGLGPDDVTTAGSVAVIDGQDVSVFAMRLNGLDMAGYAADILPLTVAWMADPQQTPGTVAARPVTIQTDGPDGPDAVRQYAYVANDILWLVRAVDPTLTDIIGQLPCPAGGCVPAPSPS